jgi:heme/copper-type cytochrome/quinol oxidase subunit 2
MNDQQGKKKRDSQLRHRRQFAWQILAPVLISLILVLVILVFLALNTGAAPATNEKWAQISTIFLSLPVIAFSFLALMVVLLLTWLIHKLRKVIPPYSGAAFRAIDRANQITNQVTEKGLSPLIQSKSIIAGIKRLFSLAFHISNNREE